ncbi:hypothetical protein EVG20_g1698 [Dentipellis fragilis]|uniref:Fungal-type protein kinase domain-containing protein n=1 Tax=Dentipellis fragilis TaxID=205917 RepID=A0A4Y9ZA08_9AGAM|nr:hypothetical protein EVG20_g1698 [Dentipellis fragilis]
MPLHKSYYPESLRKRADTPIRRSYQLPAPIPGYLELYLLGKIGLADTDWFLSNILPVPLADVDQVFTHVSPLLYDDSRWTGMSRLLDDAEEVDQMHKPFIDVSNNILKACKELSVPLELGNVHWRCDLDESLTSIDELVDELDDYPRVVASLGRGTDEKDWLDWQKQILGLVKEANKDAISETLYEKLAENLSTWWLRRVHVPVEFRVTDDADTARLGLDQLCRYMREILMAQLDRQFVIGLLVCKSKLSIWLHDRSGLLGMQTPIDIREEPKKFVHVIMAFSRLDPSRLGWDPTMKIFCKSDGKHRLSTDPDLKLADYGSTVLGTQWAVFVPKTDGSTDGEWYTTIRLLNTIRFDRVMLGSTLVWAVSKAGEKERLVLKQTWRPSVLLQEAELRSAAPPQSNVSQIIRSVDIGYVNDNGAPACMDTKLFIRRGMIGRPPAEPRLKGWSVADNKGTVVVIKKHFISAQRLAFSFTNRVLTRTLMSTYGWPLTSFRDIRELLETIRDAVAGHRDLWFGGVLHRDVSVDNILICPEEKDGRKTCGRLIDLGFSIKADTWTDAPGPLPADMSKAWDRIRLLGEYYEIQISEPVALTLLSRGEDRLYPWTYLEAVFKRWPHLRDTSPHSKDDLFLYDWESPPPAWKSSMVYRLDRKGRQAFLSGEVHSTSHFYHRFDTIRRKTVITKNSADSKEDERSSEWDDRCAQTETGELRQFSEDHSAIHDLESFWWILLYICLSRNGPGGAQRDELFQQRDEEALWLGNIVDCLFETKDEYVRRMNKVELFTNLDHLQSFIIPRFHPYFKGLEKLIMDWRTVLHFAYETYDKVTPGIIHRLVLAVLDDVLKDLQSAPLEQDTQAAELTQKEDDRRARDLNELDDATAELARIMEFSSKGKFNSQFHQSPS